MAVFFNGRLLITPTVESLVDDSAMMNKNLSVGNTLCIIGRSEGGEPKTLTAVRSPSHARQLLRSWELLRAVERAFAPSTETKGPSKIYFMRVNPALQSALTLSDGASHAVISLVSTDYGAYTNQIKVKIEAGTLGGKKVTTQVGNRYFYGDNIGQQPMLTIAYTGAADTGGYAVTAGQLRLTTESSTPVNVDLSLSEFDTVIKLADKINTVPDWSATVTPGMANKSSNLDFGAATAIAINGTKDLYAICQNVIDWLNSTAEGYVTAAPGADGYYPPADIPLTTLSGGSDGNVTNTDWYDCFAALQSEDVQWIVPLSSEIAVWAMADAHCHYMSGPGKMERRCFVGGATGVDIDAATANGALLNSDRTSYCWPGYYDFNERGEYVLEPAYMLAALLGAGFSSVNPGEAMTNKSLRIYGLEVPVANPTDTDALITSGVLTVEKTKYGYRVVKSISTWLNDSKYNRVEVSCGAAVDFTVRNVREALRTMVGMKASPKNLKIAESRTESALKELAREEPAGPGILVGDDEHPAYRNITAEIEGDVLRVEFECSPVIPLNYVLITVHAVPYSSI